MKVAEAIMSAANTPVLTVAALLGFLWLGHASQQEHGYTHDQIDAVSRLLAPKKLDKRAALMDLWQLSEADVAEPVRIWGRR